MKIKMSDQNPITSRAQEASASLDAYVEYRRTVGDDDGGTLFTPEEYENYKKTVLAARIKNRLYTSWVSSTGMDCKLIGPETICFCQHRYKQHKTDFKELPSTRPILLPCRIARCGCASYHYVPVNGSQPIRCHCKHYSDDHSVIEPFKCKKSSCGKCFGFSSSYTCGCQEPYHTHYILVETESEREARGHPIGQPTPYAAMGGLTGFSSLAEGYLRLDPSGLGSPSEEFLSQPIHASDNPFLRANLQALVPTNSKDKGRALSDEEKKELESSLQRPDETEIEYFERRYQERQKLLFIEAKPLGYLYPKREASTSSQSSKGKIKSYLKHSKNV